MIEIDFAFEDLKLRLYNIESLGAFFIILSMPFGDK